MKAIRSLFKLYKRTNFTASTERPSKTRTEVPASLHIREAQPSNEEAGAQMQHAASPGMLTIDGDANTAPTESQTNTRLESPVSHLKKNADPPQLENRDATQRSSVSGTPAVYNAVKVGMGLMKEVSTAFGPLEAVVRGLSFILEHHEKWAANKGVIKRLVCRIETLRTAFEEMGEGQSNDKNTQRRDALLKKLQVIAVDIEIISNKHKLSSYIAAGADEDTLSALVNDIQDTLIDYQTITQIEIDARTAQLIRAEEDRLLLQLPRAPDASHLSETHRSCLKGTRVGLLNDLEAWSEDPESPQVLWLNGHAGSGKSTLIQSFCQSAFSVGRLGASFFCSSAYTDRKDLRMIFPTLAFQLARRFPVFRARLVATLKHNPDVARRPLKAQFTELIVAPLENTGISTIIVIDALDECQDEEQVLSYTLLSLLPEYVIQIPSIKFFVTARPEPPIREAFRVTSLQALTKVLILGDAQRSSVDHDIYVFLKTRLSEAMMGRSDVDLPSPWPSNDDLWVLTAMSGQLFIFAATAAAFISSQYDQPAERLELLKAMPEKNTGIDGLYRTVLLQGYPKNPDPDYAAQWRLVVGAIFFLDYVVGKSRDFFAIFLNLEASKIASILRPLHAVMKIPKAAARPISLYHKSFYDYLTNPTRCVDPTFFVDYHVHQALLAKQCFWFMGSVSLHGGTYAGALHHEQPQFRVLSYCVSGWKTHLQCQYPLLDVTIRMQLISQIEELLETKLDKWAATHALLNASYGFNHVAVESLDKFVSDLPTNLPERNKLASMINRTLRIATDLQQKKLAAKALKRLQNNPLHSDTESQHSV
ncbi:hypothetical protein Hypma_011278 [Hypsizygus marmoreus]|uniref:NACHT domain-containing protein n=1 Tax=Hypsizygus marmoreus TaxID=39966 RepID=A0A369JHK5_HYPMA|nr:hypothetical protein Hypma_011278 [Hypsizygus marmoreus]